MADYIVEGKKGAGKTYFVMWYVLQKYFEWNSDIKEYVSKSSTLFISNIDKLKFEHLDLNVLIDKYGMAGVFSGDFMESLREKYHCRYIILLIDECQRIFHNKYYDRDVFGFFQYSRHYGVDTFFITQDVETVCRHIRTLAEKTFHAVSRTNAIGRSFRYREMDNDECIGVKVLKVDQRIFRFYSSFRYEESEKPKSVIWKYALGLCGLLLFSVIIFKYVFLANYGDAGKMYTMSGKVIDRKDVKASSFNYSVSNKGGVPVYSSVPSSTVVSPSVAPSPVPVDSVPEPSEESICRVRSKTVIDGDEIESSYCQDGSVETRKNGELIRTSFDRGYKSGSDRRGARRPLGG